MKEGDKGLFSKEQCKKQDDQANSDWLKDNSTELHLKLLTNKNLENMEYVYVLVFGKDDEVEITDAQYNLLTKNIGDSPLFSRTVFSDGEERFINMNLVRSIEKRRVRRSRNLLY